MPPRPSSWFSRLRNEDAAAGRGQSRDARRHPAQRRCCRLDELFTLTGNDFSIVFMGYHGALWASTGTSNLRLPRGRLQDGSRASFSLSSI